MSNRTFILIMATCAAVIAGQFLWVFREHRRRQAERREREAEERWRDHPDPSAVEAQRQLYADGAFRRKILSWSPGGLQFDRGDMECGHYTVSGLNRQRPESIDCEDCAREYLKKARLTGRQR